MIQVSHEVPISLLEESRSFNDYDYCLVHLWDDEHPVYKKFFQESLAQGRKVLLDNSVFELGTAFREEVYAQRIKELKPTWYVVPDVLSDCDKTISNMDHWLQKYQDLPGIIMGCIQGKTFEEMAKCYVYMAGNPQVGKIGIPFRSVAYDAMFSSYEDPLYRWYHGRRAMIKYLVDQHIWNNEKPHHLLGASYVREFAHDLYRQLNIDTLDTSSPVTCGITGVAYTETGNPSKPQVKLCELIQYSPTEQEQALMNYNINIFKKLLNESLG